MYVVYVVDVVSVVYDVVDIVDVVTVNLPGLHLNSYASHFAAGSSGFKAVVPSNTTCVKKRKKIGVHEIGQQDWYKMVHKNVISL